MAGHLALGVAYFELDLGEEALGEFVRAQRLAPGRYEGFALAAPEYRYASDYSRASQACQQAPDRNPELPPFGEILPCFTWVASEVG